VSQFEFEFQGFSATVDSTGIEEKDLWETSGGSFHRFYTSVNPLHEFVGNSCNSGVRVRSYVTKPLQACQPPRERLWR